MQGVTYYVTMGIIDSFLSNFGYTKLSDPKVTELTSISANASLPVPVNEENMSNVSAVFRAMKLISDTIGFLNPHLIRESNGVKERILDHPAVQALKYPSPALTATHLKTTVQQSVLRSGNGYLEIIKSRSGNPLGFEYIPWQDVRMTLHRQTNGLVSARYHLANGRYLEAHQVLHIKGLTLDSYLGRSPLRDMREALSGIFANQKFHNNFYKNGANLSGMLKIKKSLGNNPEQRREARKMMLSEFKGENTGIDNAHTVALMDEDIDYIRLGIPPQEAQFLETRQFSIADVGRFFSVNLAYLYASEGKYNNYEHMQLEFYTHTMLPWLTVWQNEMNLKLLTAQEQKAGYRFKFNVKGLLRADTKTRGEWFERALRNQWMTVNEVRELEDENPVSWGDEPIISRNYYHPDEQIGGENA